MTDLLACRGLHKSFYVKGKEVPVLNGVDLSVKPGETLAVMGASGSGKSTLLYCLGMLDNPDSGDILWHGDSLLDMPAKEQERILSREVGFVFQSYHLVPECTVLENVLLAERAVTRTGGTTAEGRDRAKELIDRVGLGHRIDHLPSELSGGEQQRVAISRALLNQPTLLLADEPTGNLDTNTGGQVYDMLMELVEGNNASMIVVTHNPALANLCSRTLQLDAGKVVGS